ncbi:glycerophosphodiester phosphodiesterase [Geodermatophilus sabuli]|uniref:Glycerophosphoryl diester phosphodiesterase/deoxyribonuclease-2 n=1 Tax=Geodermatophilus sabuli TaxID=1564158 RepID=A0A285EFB2_9ACTN|nr:glycerophosphodiester phosphodiesterase [Geodermatophilus sabuli]MBB3086230.1 glycerophosphoryl diester phosphodiesterase [Geodermatophilus sabuli]SNX97553.1 glycerophosphoryl diester phosphodiesterase/deoxyribonuclease-2 [Geodermatophilus sabuli]
MDESNGSGRQVAALPQDPFLPSGRDDRVRVLGHRGAPGPGRPDNSVAAVTEALLRGADGAEVDVWLTADGTLVCSHDPVVAGPGRSALATLPELLAAAQQPAGVRLVVEAKPVSDPVVAARTATALADDLSASAGGAALTLSSFDPALLARVRAACADLPVRTALLGDRSAPAAVVVQRAHEDGHDEVHLPLAGVLRMPEVVARARDLGLSVTVWTVNARPALRWVAGLGVDAVITDDVVTARRELDRAAAVRETVAA